MNCSNFETELNNKGVVMYTNVGDSMMPMIKEGRDVLIIKRPKTWDDKSQRKLKKGDVALYKRDNGQYVLHRVIRVRKNDYVFCGDNRRGEEFGISDRHIIGLLTGIIRNGKEQNQGALSNKIYKKYALCSHSIKVINHKFAKKIRKKETDYKALFLSLIYCSLNSINADRLIPENADLEKLFFLANSHSLSALVFISLSKTRAFANADIQAKNLWIQKSAKVQRKEILLSAERNAIENELENCEIWYLPLKGAILNRLYPKTGTREMSDIDIYYDKTKREEVERIFLSRGYEKDELRDYYEDAFTKKPMLHFEMHTELFEKNKYPVLAEYYSDIKSRLFTQEGRKYGKRFSDEDFYIFIIAHSYKHFSNNGTGLRTLVDIFLLAKNTKSVRSSNYVKNELKKLGAYEFEQGCVSLSEKLFKSRESLTKYEKELLNSFLISDTYGSHEAKLNRKIQKNGGSKFSYAIKRAFPNKEFCKNEYPFFYKYPVFMPFFWIYRLVKPKKNKAKLKNEINILTKKGHR